MNRLIYILSIIMLMVILPSCFEDGTIVDEIESTPNLVGFENSTQSLSAVTDGSVYDFTVPIKVFGPSASEMEGSVTAKISIDKKSSTAVEGTHFNLESKEIKLSSDGDFLGVIPIEVITEGIDAPLDENPQLVLNVDQVSGNSNVVASGKQIVLTLFYLCYADLSGTYTVTNDVCMPTFTAEITRNPDGSWHLSSADGGFLHQCTSNTSLLNSGNIVELCGKIQPSGDLEFGSDGGTYTIGDITGGTWNAEDGVLKLKHVQTFFSSLPSSYTSTYTRQ